MKTANTLITLFALATGAGALSQVQTPAGQQPVSAAVSANHKSPNGSSKTDPTNPIEKTPQIVRASGKKKKRGVK